MVAAVDLAEKASAGLAKLGRARLVALLFVVGGAMRRAEAAETLHCSLARPGRACTFLRASPPPGLNLLEHADRL